MQRKKLWKLLLTLKHNYILKDYKINSNNNYDELIGYWVGILNLKDIIKSIKNLNLKDNERIVILDQNGTIITDSKMITIKIVQS